MKIGEKIKKLRTEKSMTQNELAGTQITRNMLSLIESGAAQPSLQTILYLAGRLNVPAGILVADDNDDYFYHRMSAMKDIRCAYSNGDYKICLDICEKLQNNDVNDDELSLIRAECCLNVGKEEFSSGHLKSACLYFDKACDLCKDTIYTTSHIQAESAVYCEYMRENVSQTLYSDCADNGVSKELAANDEFCRYCKALELLGGENDIDVKNYIDSGKKDNVYVSHIKALLLMKNHNYEEAHRTILDIFNSSENVAAPILYALFCNYEICCRETGDFKGAYEYAGTKVVMLERLLSEIDI